MQKGPFLAAGEGSAMADRQPPPFSLSSLFHSLLSENKKDQYEKEQRLLEDSIIKPKYI
jgi:hypothetical protein